MSTTFDVYPGKGYIPLFSELLCDTEREVNNYLRSIDVNKDIKLNARIQSNDDSIKTPVGSTSRLIWDDSSYAWFYIKDVSGGTDAYFHRHDEMDTDFLLELTEGLIYTDDGAWDYDKFPADPDEFLKWYFRLESSDAHNDICLLKDKEIIWAQESVFNQ